MEGYLICTRCGQCFDDEIQEKRFGYHLCRENNQEFKIVPESEIDEDEYFPLNPHNTPKCFQKKQ